MRRGLALALAAMVVFGSSPTAAGERRRESLAPSISPIDAYFNFFGQAVDIDLDTGTVVVGAYGHLPNRAGAAYAIERDAEDWVYTLLQPPSPAANARAGSGVAIDGDLVAVGAPHDRTIATEAGAVYLFRRVDDSWEYEVTLAPEELLAGDLFGFYLDMDGGRIAVAATNTDDGPGRVFVFERRGGSWEYDVVAPPSGRVSDWFGRSVRLEGDLLAVGASGVDGEFDDQGAVYLYRRSAGQWVLEAEIAPQDPYRKLYFGTEMAIQDGRIAVGAPGDFDDGVTTGRIYLLARIDGVWTQEIAYRGHPEHANMPTSLVLDGDRILAGSLGYDDFLDEQGDVLVLGLDEGLWFVDETIPGPWRYPSEVGFGWSMAGTADAFVVGAPGYRIHGEFSGQVFAFGLGPVCGGLPPTVLGTSDDDVIEAMPGAEVIFTGSGDDIVSGVGGDDIVCSGRGRDVVDGPASSHLDRSRRDWQAVELGYERGPFLAD